MKSELRGIWKAAKHFTQCANSSASSLLLKEDILIFYDLQWDTKRGGTQLQTSGRETIV